MARSLPRYVLLLSCALAALSWPALAQRASIPSEPPPAPLLPAEQAWAVELPSPPSAGGAIDARRAYVPLQSAELVALDRETGAVAWSAPVESRWPPLVEHGAVYVVGDRRLVALSGEYGTPFWQATLAADVAAPLAMSHGLLVTILETNEVQAFRRTDGALVWSRSLGPRFAPVSMAGDETGVYIAQGSRLARLAHEDGSLLWERTLPGVLSPPTLAAGRVHVGSTENDFYAFEIASGRLGWRWRFGGDVVGATADRRHLYVVSLDNLVRALLVTNGNQIWKRALSTRPVAAPDAFGGTVAVAGNEPALAAFDARSGQPLGTFTTEADLQGKPLIDSVLLPFRVSMVIVTRDGRAVGLRPTGMMFREGILVPLQSLPGRSLDREPRP